MFVDYCLSFSYLYLYIFYNISFDALRHLEATPDKILNFDEFRVFLTSLPIDLFDAGIKYICSICFRVVTYFSYFFIYIYPIYPLYTPVICDINDGLRLVNRIGSRLKQYPISLVLEGAALATLFPHNNEGERTTSSSHAEGERTTSSHEHILSTHVEGERTTSSHVEGERTKSSPAQNVGSGRNSTGAFLENGI